MKRFLAVCVFLFCLPAYAHHLAVVAHQDNHQQSLTSAELGKILKSETRKWPNGNDIKVVLVKNSLVTRQVLQRLAGVRKGEEDAFLAAHKTTFVLVNSDAELLRLVEGTPGALGVVDVRSIDGKVVVLRIDGKLPMEPGYLPH